MKELSRFSPKRTSLKLQGLKFKEFFAWLSESVVKVSQSISEKNKNLDLHNSLN